MIKIFLGILLLVSGKQMFADTAGDLAALTAALQKLSEVLPQSKEQARASQEQLLKEAIEKELAKRAKFTFRKFRDAVVKTNPRAEILPTWLLFAAFGNWQQDPTISYNDAVEVEVARVVNSPQQYLEYNQQSQKKIAEYQSVQKPAAITLPMGVQQFKPGTSFGGASLVRK